MTENQKTLEQLALEYWKDKNKGEMVYDHQPEVALLDENIY